VPARQLVHIPFMNQKRPESRLKHVLLWGLVLPVTMARAAEVSLSGREAPIDWPSLIRQHDIAFDKLPGGCTEAPHFGNATLGSMLYQEGGMDVEFRDLRAEGAFLVSAKRSGGQTLWVRIKSLAWSNTASRARSASTAHAPMHRHPPRPASCGSIWTKARKSA
jgi:hypothetical protein